MDKKISIIGAGNMGGAIYKGLKKILSPEKLYICDRNEEKIETLSPVHGSADLKEAISFADVILLAVKPQSFTELEFKAEDKLILSIMAGVSVKTISDQLKAKKVIRAMPNLPIQVSAGVTGWFASAKVDDEEKEFVSELFSSFGLSIELEKEPMLDVITALSGSGPAYFFYLTELLAEKAVEEGIPEEAAQTIAQQTLLGASELLNTGERSAKAWREAVTSKGGTTEAAINYLQEQKWGERFKEAVEKAKKRSSGLGA